MKEKRLAAAVMVVSFCFYLADRLMKEGVFGRWGAPPVLHRDFLFFFDVDQTLAVVVMAASIVLFFVALTSLAKLCRGSRTIMSAWFFMFVLGAISNAMDRLMVGGVVNWMTFSNTLSLNGADVMIAIGLFGSIMTVYDCKSLFRGTLRN